MELVDGDGDNDAHGLDDADSPDTFQVLKMPATSGHSYTEEGGASPVPGGSWLAQVSFFWIRESSSMSHYAKYCQYFNCLVLLIIKSTPEHCQVPCPSAPSPTRTPWQLERWLNIASS